MLRILKWPAISRLISQSTKCILLGLRTSRNNLYFWQYSGRDPGGSQHGVLGRYSGDPLGMLGVPLCHMYLLVTAPGCTSGCGRLAGALPSATCSSPITWLNSELLSISLDSHVTLKHEGSNWSAQNFPHIPKQISIIPFVDMWCPEASQVGRRPYDRGAR